MESHTLNRKQRRALNAMSKKEKPLIDAKDDTGWDDLHQLYVECKSISVNPARIFPFLKNENLINSLSDEDKQFLISNLSKLSEEIKEHHERLEGIYEKHKNWTGSTQTPDELMICLNIGEYYQQWLMSYQVLIMPVVQRILEIINQNQPLEPHSIQDPILNALSEDK